MMLEVLLSLVSQTLAVFDLSVVIETLTYLCFFLLYRFSRR
jgi:hypothetical protein